MDYIRGDDRDQEQLLPESLDDYVEEDNPVRFIDAFVDSLHMANAALSTAYPCAGDARATISGTFFSSSISG